MPYLKLIKYIRESFGAKIFLLFTCLIVVIHISFTALLVYNQGQLLRQHLIDEGEQLSGLLAYNSRLGVFAENEDLLKYPVGGILQNDEVILVQVFTVDGRELKTEESPAISASKKRPVGLRHMSKETMDMLSASGPAFYSETEGWIEFWAPVTSRVNNAGEEDLLLNRGPTPQKEIVTGFVRTVLTTEILNRNLRELLFKSLTVLGFFIIPAWLITYFMVKGATRPLKRLTGEVKALGAGSSVKKIYAGRDDEIGRLAQAFNGMAESLKKREEEKQIIEEQLRHTRKVEAMGIFAGGIAHDFNNILGAIIGYAELLQKKNNDEEFAGHCVRQILSVADKGEALTKGLLTYTRKRMSFPEAVNLNDLIRNMEEILRRLLKEDMEFTVETAGEDLIVTADPGQIEQVLMNLATNARDAMPDGGTLTIRTRKIRSHELRVESNERPAAADYAEISITDTGTGMDQDTKDKMFDPFFTTKKAGLGTGLGLSIVFGIIKEHKGYLLADSGPGQGTTFSIFLPLRGPEGR
ncbi:MAG: HAMP domain-containing protein [Nitrospiraceae bacterium]|nr:MAG: HAMP domain-containing protein [Nitrospiraceae bacterium]